MAGKLEVLFITDGIFPHAIGGMQRHSALLIEALAKTGEVDLIVVHPHSKQVFDAALGIREIQVPFSFDGLYVRKVFDYGKKTAEIIKQHPHALVYAQGICVLSGLRSFGHRVIVNPHGLEPFQSMTFSERLKTWPFRMYERFQFRYAAKVVSLGGRLTSILTSQMKGREEAIVVLPNAVNPDIKPERKFDANPLSFLFVGRFAFNKGINLLMQAVKELNEEGYQDAFTYNLVGKGPLYESYTKEYNYNNVHFIGFADDDKLMELYRKNDLFVFPTRFEGMPTVVLEAMAAGMPIVVSDTGATAELVQSDNGFLIPTNDVPALKKAILDFYRMSPEDRKRLSDASHQKVVERFTWEKVARLHLQLFHDMVNRK